MELCRIEEIRLLLERHGFSFSRGLGQNFLCDPDIPREIVRRADITPEECVLEVGPGIGALSAQLCRSAKKVAAVELDGRLPAILAETMADCPNFTLIPGDILTTDLKVLCREQFGDGPALACANLPYYITSPAILHLLESGCFSRVVVMVQKEAAQRICAAPGDKNYCALSAQVAWMAQPRVILEVSRDRFVPQPQVDSVVLRLDARPDREEGERKRVFRAIRAAFANRRKTLVNGLCLEYGRALTKAQAEAIVTGLGHPAAVRGEALSAEELADLAGALEKALA